MSTEQGFLRQAIYCLNRVLPRPCARLFTLLPVVSAVLQTCSRSDCRHMPECLPAQVIFMDKTDLHAQWDRAVLYSDVNEPRKVRMTWLPGRVNISIR